MRENIKKEQKIEITKKTYEQIAPLFAQTRKKKDRVLEIFFTRFKPKGKVLDVGCGSCRSLKYLIKNNFFTHPNNSYLGIDYSANLIKTNCCLSFAKKYPSKIKLKNIDARKISCKNKFDYVMALAVLHHFPDKDLEKVLLKIYHSLKQGGLFAGYVWYPCESLRKKWKKINTNEYLKFWQKQKSLPLYYHLFDSQKLSQYLRNAGFKNIKTQTIAKGTKRNILFWAEK